ncbi:hypothetical protein NDU88_001335 [Pleurodeles waltl]|uniref:Uncharacterized protein n=1 Tax=Pleurodeles waltl TaxID=8319 RepID=A0AAV7RCQ6_PLEWA|nr:hypothetical protein NDU88_001335 [Pleurodeles waltl]
MSEPGSMLQPEDIEEILRAAGEVATMHNKELLLVQIRGGQANRNSTEEPSEASKSEELVGGKREASEEAEGPKKRCCNPN